MSDIARSNHPDRQVAPVRVLVLTIIGVFLADVVAILLIDGIKSMPFALHTLLDALIMIVLIFPLLYLLSFKPLLSQLAERERAETELRSAQAGLEQRVQERTNDLVQANESLQQEIALRQQTAEELRIALRTANDYQREVTSLLEGARAVLNHQPFAEAARSIFMSCKSQVGADSGFVALIREGIVDAAYMDNGAFSCGVASDLPLTIRGLRQQTITSGKPVIVNEFATSASQALIPSGHMPIQNVLMAPLKINSDVIGLIALSNKPGGFTLDDARVASAFAEMATGALFNSHAGDELRKARDELELRVLERTSDLQKSNAELKTEIAERLRVESQLRLQSAALEAAANGIIITDHLGNVRWANPAFTHMTGYTREEILGQNLRLLKSGRHEPELYEQMWNTIRSGKVWRGEIINRRKDGSQYYEEQTITPFLEENNEIANFIAIKQDITDRKQVEMRLAFQNQELIAVSEAEHSQRQLAEGLLNSVMAITSSLELEDVLSVVLDQIRQAIPFRGGAIALIDGKTFRVTVSRGLEDLPDSISDLGQRYSLGDFPQLQQICDSLQPLVIQDTLNQAKWQVPPGFKWVRSYLGIPMIREGQVTGIISLISEEPGFFNSGIAERVTDYAIPAALALHNAQLYKAELTGRKAAEALSAAAQALIQTLNLDQVINILLDHLAEIAPSDLSGVALLEDETHLGTRAIRGFNRWAEVNLPAMHLEIEDFPSLQAAISTRKSFLLRDVDQNGNKNDIPWLNLFQSWLVVPIVAGEKVIGVVGLSKEESGYFTREHQQWVETLVGQAAMTIQNAWLFEQVRASSERLQFLSRRLVEAQENELRYVSQELHDEIGQALTSLVLSLQLIDRNADHPDNTRVEVKKMEQVLESAMENLHRLAMDLRPAALDQVGLEAALRQHIKIVCERFGLEIKFEMIGVGERLSAKMEIALYRIVQEALNNIVRHARATHADILIRTRADSLIMIIEDNGIGFDPEIVMQGDHLGIFGMRERAEMMGGKLTLESRAKKGTTLLVEVPYANSHTDH